MIKSSSSLPGKLSTNYYCILSLNVNVNVNRLPSPSVTQFIPSTASLCHVSCCADTLHQFTGHDKFSSSESYLFLHPKILKSARRHTFLNHTALSFSGKFDGHILDQVFDDDYYLLLFVPAALKSYHSTSIKFNDNGDDESSPSFAVRQHPSPSPIPQINLTISCPVDIFTV